MTSLSLAQLPGGITTAPPPPAAPTHAARPGHLVDSHGRVIRDLRLSVTDRCNFRCVYCMDPDFRYMPKQELLTLDEYVALVRVCVGLGITKVRITGGEPTLYPRLDELIEQLAQLDIPDLSMTTNGSLVTRAKAMRWKALGLRRLTLSLDSLRPERVAAITRAKVGPDAVINAIHLAQEAGLGPVKVNAVIMRGVNDDEVADMADFAREHSVDYRLIEFMPLDSEHGWSVDKVFSAREMLERIEERHTLLREADDEPSSTSMNFRFAESDGGTSVRPVSSEGQGRIGLIAPVTRPFCGACSRLRITADGKVRPCLFSHQEWDIRAVLRGAAAPGHDSHSMRSLDSRLRQFLVDSMWTKQAGHGIGSRAFHQPERTMSAIGG